MFASQLSGIFGRSSRRRSWEAVFLGPLSESGPAPFVRRQRQEIHRPRVLRRPRGVLMVPPTSPSPRRSSREGTAAPRASERGIVLPSRRSRPDEEDATAYGPRGAASEGGRPVSVLAHSALLPPGDVDAGGRRGDGRFGDDDSDPARHVHSRLKPSTTKERPSPPKKFHQEQCVEGTCYKRLQKL